MILRKHLTKWTTAYFHKIKDLGITGRLGIWIHSFLTLRTQQVIVNGFLTEESAITSGVPQGSVLGPLLFLILMNDIDENLTKSYLLSFADDTNLSKPISTEEDVDSLQQDLITIYNWAKNNNMSFNDKKFELLRYGKNDILKSTTQLLTGRGQAISANDHVKCLGIHLSSDATFQYHIEEIE